MIEWGVASRALPGETRSGDLHVVESFAGGALVAAVDGLGHGEEAADAADRVARSKEHEYVGARGDTIRWTLHKVENVQELFDQCPGEGTEVRLEVARA